MKIERRNRLILVDNLVISITAVYDLDQKVGYQVMIGEDCKVISAMDEDGRIRVVREILNRLNYAYTTVVQWSANGFPLYQELFGW